MLGTLLTFFAVAIATVVAAWVVLMVLGAVFSLTFGLATFLLFKVAPILLVGWVVIKLFDKIRGKSSLSAADRKWLEGD